MDVVKRVQELLGDSDQTQAKWYDKKKTFTQLIIYYLTRSS